MHNKKYNFKEQNDTKNKYIGIENAVAKLPGALGINPLPKPNPKK
ncbi:hypothetical protein [Candidatus Legionella polyplacis]|uniref:Uncharacterized protein n=1 Tax=Candidatus Legionella polyplacis TaxID=2005262 RepID=A0ABZ2GVS5_9GAMM|nr:hypothetical protein [Candidatus Legionella polyplacis]